MVVEGVLAASLTDAPRRDFMNDADFAAGVRRGRSGRERELKGRASSRVFQTGIGAERGDCLPPLLRRLRRDRVHEGSQ